MPRLQFGQARLVAALQRGHVRACQGGLGRAIAVSEPVTPQRLRSGRWLVMGQRALVAWIAHVYLRVAGATGRY